MRKTLLVAGLIGALGAPTLAHASCHSRKVTGAVVGGLGGGIIGAAAATLPWGFAAAGLGALTGHAIAGATCHEHWRHAYYRREYYRHEYYRREY
jgi:hypothetical protein